MKLGSGREQNHRGRCAFALYPNRSERAGLLELARGILRQRRGHGSGLAWFCCLAESSGRGRVFVHAVCDRERLLAFADERCANRRLPVQLDMRALFTRYGPGAGPQQQRQEPEGQQDAVEDRHAWILSSAKEQSKGPD
jgi:hypothetical protein